MADEQKEPPKERPKHGKVEPSQPLIDPDYVKRMANRAVFLEKKSLSTREATKTTKYKLFRSQTDLQIEITDLRKELEELDESIYETVERVKTAVTKFQYIAKKGDLLRIQQRVDAWAPEKRLSRDQFQQLLIDTDLVKE